jgi:two-component system cell cycle sensor histidine kinase/response regulator CckA
MNAGNQELQDLRARVAELERQLDQRSRSDTTLETLQKRAEQTMSVLRHTEQRFRALFDSNVIGIVEINHESVLDANESFLQMTGQSRETVLSGTIRWRDMTPAKYGRIDEQAHERAIQSGSFPPFEKEFYRKDGSLLPVWVGGVLLNQPPDWTCIAFVLDLSERKALEEQSRSAQKLKTLGLLSSIIAHDFNNLLTTIIGNASLSLDKLGCDHPAYEKIEEVLRASQLASGLTDQLVNYSAKPRSTTNNLELSKLVREIGELIELPLSPKVHMEWSLAPGLPFVNGDGYLIQQILMNLVINASDALDKGGGTIRIVTHCRDYSRAELQATTSSGAHLPAGTYVAVEVQDTGCGMSQEVKTHIFDPLFTTKTKGRGLGLASALGIVRSHRGAIDVRSQVGEGTTFVILFPACMEAEICTEVADVASSELRGQGTVLVVDDEPSVRRLAEATLSRYGYRVLLAADGREGIEIYKREAGSVSLIIMDLGMPVMSGEEALEELMTLTPRPKVLFSSGFNERESLIRLEGFPFLQKPYTSKELAERVKLHASAT